MTEETHVVLPISASHDAVVATSDEAWRLLAEERGILVTLAPGNISGEGWGPLLAGTSGLARNLLTVADRAGRSASMASNFFRVEVPAGQTIQQLMPAVGGGFRGMTRNATGISSHARLVPVSGTAVGAGIALGPLVGLMALSVGAEMLARHQQDQQLKAIRRGVEALEKHALQELVAKLEVAEQALNAASAAVLDEIRIPQGVGYGPAVNGLRQVRHQGLGWLDTWEERFGALAKKTKAVDHTDVVKAMGTHDVGGHRAFAHRVALLYRSVVLDSRARMLTRVEAGLEDPTKDLANFARDTEQGLKDNAEILARLRVMLFDASHLAITTSYFASSSVEKDVVRFHQTFAALARGMSEFGSTPAVMSPQNRIVLELAQSADGTWQARKPAELSATL